MPRKKQYQWDVETNGQEAPEQLSRSAKKRQSSALQDLGAELTKLPVNELDRLPLTPDLLEALRLYARISNREGKRRQLQFIGRLMREVDAGPLAEAIEAARTASRPMPPVCTWPNSGAKSCSPLPRRTWRIFWRPSPGPMPKPRDARSWKNCWPKPARKMTGGRPTPAAPSSGASCVCWNSVREFFWQGKGPLLKKGLPSPCTPIPPKTFIWVRGLPERCDLRAPVLIRPFVGVSFPSSPAFPLCPATGSALTVREKAVHTKAVCPSSCVKALLP